MPTVDDVIAEIAVAAPQLLPHMKVDRAWLWYCGPALTGKANEGTRQALKDLGFRFAPKGRTVDGVVGYWAHSCTAPMPRYRKGGRPAAVGEVINNNDSDAAMALLESL